MIIKKFSYLQKESSLPNSTDDVENFEYQSLVGWLSGVYKIQNSYGQYNILARPNYQNFDDDIILYYENTDDTYAQGYDLPENNSYNHNANPKIGVKVINESEFNSYINSHGWASGYDFAKDILNYKGNKTSKFIAFSPNVNSDLDSKSHDNVTIEDILENIQNSTGKHRDLNNLDNPVNEIVVEDFDYSNIGDDYYAMERGNHNQYGRAISIKDQITKIGVNSYWI